MKMIKIKCKECGMEFAKNFYEYTRKIKTGKNNFFCSLSCGTKFQLRQQSVELTKQKKLDEEDYLLNPKKCQFCDGVIPYKNHEQKTFCDSSCAAKYNNKNKIIIKKCLHCNEDYKPYKGSKGMFCTFECSLLYKKEKIDKLIVSNQYPFYFSQSRIRKYLIEKHGAKCMICGWDKINPVSGKCPIVMDHIDGHSDNNQLSNLRLLCPNCDSLTPTYKGLNKGNGRHHRMRRYHEGKSY